MDATVSDLASSITTDNVMSLYARHRSHPLGGSREKNDKACGYG